MYLLITPRLPWFHTHQTAKTLNSAIAVGSVRYIWGEKSYEN
ncbi:hypothetical protein [Pantanalinema sp. GBBB05]